MTEYDENDMVLVGSLLSNKFSLSTIGSLLS